MVLQINGPKPNYKVAQWYGFIDLIIINYKLSLLLSLCNFKNLEWSIRNYVHLHREWTTIQFKKMTLRITKPNTIVIDMHGVNQKSV